MALCWSVQNPSQNEKDFLENLSLALTKMSCEDENIILIGDLNFTVENKNLGSFYEYI